MVDFQQQLQQKRGQIQQTLEQGQQRGTRHGLGRFLRSH